MLDRSQIAVLSVIALLAGTGVFAHFHHKAGPKVVTSKVTSPAPRQAEFEPFASWGVTPNKQVPVPYNWQPERFGRVAVSHERRRKHTRCWRKLNTPSRSGLAECGGLISIWI